MPVSRYAAPEGPVLLWLPSERGLRGPQGDTARDLAELGIEVWLIDLHAAYFVPTGRDSIAAFDPADLAELIERAHENRAGSLFLVATGRGAQTALAAMRTWQRAHGARQYVGGALLFHPYLYANPPRPGADPELIDGIGANNLPIALIQPTLSAKHFRTESIVDALSAGGSPVFVHRLPGVTDGFHLRPRADLSEADLAARKTLAQLLSQLVRLLQTQTRPSTPPQWTAPRPPEDPVAVPLHSELISVGAVRMAPPLSLPGLDGELTSLRDYRGRVVLLSFWTSWCPPCVEELPSLQRLDRRLRARPFDIVSINVGEELSTVRRFLERHRIQFPVLHDAEGSTVRDWQVYAYPTNYLIDGAGRLRFGHVGAMDWDTPEVARVIESLMESQP